MKQLFYSCLFFSLLISCSEDDETAKSSQTITFDSFLPTNLSEGSVTVNATASSGLALTLTSSNSSVATISGKTLTLLKAGSTVITASQTGNDNWLDAPEISRTLEVFEDNNSAKKSQEITSFVIPTSWTNLDGELPLEATASSGLPVKFYSTSPYVEVKGGTLKLLDNAGHYENTRISVIAHQGGDTEYNASAKVSREISITHK
ncbi:MAG: hypothetical protein LBR67_10895 [Dysgonamonadaceae bacterium]|jgi:hypothetical protein|nr:hypothetical protein [Dysgonamonadaceae bacterium]